MKCAICGKEFGNGTNCQCCGVDRVTGLGNYNGYHTPARSSDGGMHSYVGMDHQSAMNQLQTSTAGSTICHACGEIIPADSKFCPYCSKELFVTCPKCGNKYSSQFPACNQCGTNRNNYYAHERLIKEEQDKATLERLKREQEQRNATERLAKEIEAKQRLKASTPEGRAELEREKRIMDQYREKWKDNGRYVTEYYDLTKEIEAKQKIKASTPEGRAELEREKRIMDEYRKKWRNMK